MKYLESYNQMNLPIKKRKNIVVESSGRLIAFLTRRSARLLTGARSLWIGCKPEQKQRIYYANHNSHIDFILLWSSLPPEIRRQTRPIAASDYWMKDGFRRFLIQDTFSGVTINRNRENGEDPLKPVKDVLAEGYSIIFFPEGTRNLEDDIQLLAFKSGLFHLSQQFPYVEVVPVWISNFKRVMPKGALVPLPLLSTVIFGKPLDLSQHHEKIDFLNYAQQELIKLKEIENQ